MQNKYLDIIGMMTGTSVDGIDVSYVKSNGLDLINLNSNYFYKFDELVRDKILNIMHENLNIKFKFKKYFDNLITKNIIMLLEKQM